MVGFLLHFFDKFEDKVRGRLSRWPIIYAFMGGVGIVLFWRGVWHMTDAVFEALFIPDHKVRLFDYLDGPLSLGLGAILLLMSGLFVSSFIGSRILASGIKGEKKISEKTEAEVRAEEGEIEKIQDDLRRLEGAIKELDSHHHPKP